MTAEPLALTSLQLYRSPALRERAAAWGALSSEARRRAAMRAAADHDPEELTELTLGYVLLRGRQHGAVSDHTLRSYAGGVRALLSAWRDENLLHPTPDAGDRFIGGLSEDLSPSTCAARLAAASALYRALHWAHATTADPFAGVHAPTDRTPRHERRRPYSDSQVAAIAAAADPRLRVLVLLCAHAGLRIAEALQLTWDDVQLPAALLRVAHGKGGRARTVHLSHTLAEALAAAHAEAPAHARYVCTRADGGRAHDATWLRRRLALACMAAGVPYLGWHAFRHTAGTRLARETGNLQLVAAHLGHADVSTAAIYAKWSDTALAETVNTW